MIKEPIYEVKSDSVSIPSSQKNSEIKFRGNTAYGNVLGVNVVLDNEDGTPFNGANVLVGIRQIGGANRVLYSPQPYRLMKHSEDVQYSERFLEITEVSGNGCDLGITIDTSKINQALVATATILYSKSR